MKRMVVIVASGLTVAGCASWSVSDMMPNFGGPTTAELSLASDPPNADARTSTGQSCRTPCRLTLPLNSGDFTVTFAAPGRIPQVVPVTIRPPDTGAASRFDPNPVYAQMEPATPPPTKKRGPPRKKAPKKRTGDAPPPPPSDPMPPPPGGGGGGGSPPGSPWPPPPR
jgi:hypothetical protein